MAKVEIIRPLFNEIKKRFKGESYKVLDLMGRLEDNPRKGKVLGVVGGVVIKEIKYRSFRFYFITDGHRLRCLDEENLTGLLLKFVRMSDKKHQQKIINEIRKILINVGVKGF